MQGYFITKGNGECIHMLDFNCLGLSVFAVDDSST